MIIGETKIHPFLHDFLVNISRRFLPFGRADLTTCALVKLSSRAERGDLIEKCWDCRASLATEDCTACSEQSEGIFFAPRNDVCFVAAHSRWETTAGSGFVVIESTEQNFAHGLH